MCTINLLETATTSQKPFKGLKKRRSTFLFNAIPFQKHRRLLVRAQDLTVSRTGNSKLNTEGSMEQWRNDTDRGNWGNGRKILYSVGGRWMDGYGAMVEWYWQGKLKYWEKNLAQVHVNNTHKCNFHLPVNTTQTNQFGKSSKRCRHISNINTVRENKLYTARGRGKHSYQCPNDSREEGVCSVCHTHTITYKVALLFASNARCAMLLSTV
jgi:hypothetical protein